MGHTGDFGGKLHVAKPFDTDLVVSKLPCVVRGLSKNKFSDTAKREILYLFCFSFLAMKCLDSLNISACNAEIS